MYYAQIQQRLAKHHGIQADRLPAFMGRLKHFQRLGWPEGANTGRGRQADYTEEMFLDLLVATEINSLGIPPEKAIEIVKSNRPSLHASLPDGGELEIHVPSAFGGRVPKSTLVIRLPQSVVPES